MFQKKVEFSDHTGSIYCLSSHKTSLYSSGADKFVVRWSLTQLKQDNFVVKLENSAFSILHLKNFPHLIIGCSNGDLHIVNTNTNLELKFIQHHKTAIFSMLEIADRNLFFTGDAAGNLCVWNNSEFNLLLQIPLESGKIRSIIQVENQIIVGSKDGKIRFFELDFFNQKDQITVNNSGIQSIKQIENRILVGGYDGYLYVFDLKTKNLLKKIPAHKGPIYSLMIFNEDFFVSASRDKSIKIWDSKTFNVLDKKEFKTGGHRNSVNQISKISNEIIASCSDDSRIILWSTT
jgi:WD40 repeat protein